MAMRATTTPGRSGVTMTGTLVGMVEDIGLGGTDTFHCLLDPWRLLYFPCIPLSEAFRRGC